MSVMGIFHQLRAAVRGLFRILGEDWILAGPGKAPGEVKLCFGAPRVDPAMAGKRFEDVGHIWRDRTVYGLLTADWQADIEKQFRNHHQAHVLASHFKPISFVEIVHWMMRLPLNKVQVEDRELSFIQFPTTGPPLWNLWVVSEALWSHCVSPTRLVSEAARKDLDASNARLLIAQFKFGSLTSIGK